MANIVATTSQARPLRRTPSSAIRDETSCGSVLIRDAINVVEIKTPIAPAAKPARQENKAVIMPIPETPINNPSAQEISVSPIIRPRFSYAT